MPILLVRKEKHQRKYLQEEKNLWKILKIFQLSARSYRKQDRKERKISQRALQKAKILALKIHNSLILQRSNAILLLFCQNRETLK